MGIFFAVTFVFWRIAEIVTLIPTVGLLAYFVNIWVTHNALTPTYIVLLFIVSVLALFYAIFTLFSYHRSRRNAVFVSFLDLCFVGAFIASVYELRFVAGRSCSSITSDPNSKLNIVVGSQNDGTIQTVVSGVDVNTNKNCTILKACFAFGIMNTIFFLITSLLVACVGREKMRERSRRGSGSRSRSRVVEETTTVRRSHSGRSHRSARGGRSGTYV